MDLITTIALSPMTMRIMTGHTVLTKIDATVTTTVIRMPVVPTLIARMGSVPTVTALMKVVSMVNLPIVALRLPVNVTLIATMFMMNPMTIATMIQLMRTDLMMIRITLSDGANLQNPMVPHLRPSPAKFLLLPPNLR